MIQEAQERKWAGERRGESEGGKRMGEHRNADLLLIRCRDGVDGSCSASSCGMRDQAWPQSF